MAKFPYHKNTASQMAIEQKKKRIPLEVNQVEVAKIEEGGKESSFYRVHFKGLEHPGYIIVNESGSEFLHYCDASAAKSTCSHFACAAAVSDVTGFHLDRTGHPKAPDDFKEFIEHVADDKYADISDTFGVVPPVKEPDPVEEEETAPAAAAPKKSTASPAPAKGKRDWRIGWNDVLDYLKAQSIAPGVLVKVQERRKAICDTVMMSPMAVEPKKPDYPYDGEMIGRALRHILMGKDLILVGDKGSGKDTIVNTLCWIFSLPVYLQTGNGGETKESVVGDRTIKQGAKGMEVEFEFSPFATAVREGGISSYPELNMLSGDVTSLFHSVLDENKQLATQVGSVERHDHHIFIGSINVGDQYSGVKSLNGALKDRCAILNMPYVQNFREMLIRKAGLTDSHALDFLEKTKKAIDDLVANEGSGEESRTIRGYIDAARYLKDYGITLETKTEVLEDFVINKTDDREEQFAIRSQIRMAVWSDFPKSAEEELYENGH